MSLRGTDLAFWLTGEGPLSPEEVKAIVGEHLGKAREHVSLGHGEITLLRLYAAGSPANVIAAAIGRNPREIPGMIRPAIQHLLFGRRAEAKDNARCFKNVEEHDPRMIVNAKGEAEELRCSGTPSGDRMPRPQAYAAADSVRALERAAELAVL